MSEARNEPGARAVGPQVTAAAWRSLPWRARLILMLHRSWPQVTRLPFFRRWFAWAGVRLITEVALAKKRRREGTLPDSGLSPDDPVGARGDRLISRIILAVGLTVIFARHLGRLVLSIGAFAFLIPFLLWPPLWPELRIAYDAARHEMEDEDEDPR